MSSGDCASGWHRRPAGAARRAFEHRQGQPVPAERQRSRAGDRRGLDACPHRLAALEGHRPAGQHLRLHLADHARRPARQRHGQRAGARVHRPPRRGRPAAHPGRRADHRQRPPRRSTEPGSEKRASDILRSTDQYRLDIQANPSVPILEHLLAGADQGGGRAPGQRRGRRAARLPARARRRQGIDPNEQVRLEQLGPGARRRHQPWRRAPDRRCSPSSSFSRLAAARSCSSPACAAGGRPRPPPSAGSAATVPTAGDGVMLAILAPRRRARPH